MLQRSAKTESLIEVLDHVLDKGIVIDAWVSLSLIGISMVTVEARIVVASVQTYLKNFEAVGQAPMIAAPLHAPFAPALQDGR